MGVQIGCTPLRGRYLHTLQANEVGSPPLGGGGQPPLPGQEYRKVYSYTLCGRAYLLTIILLWVYGFGRLYTQFLNLVDALDGQLKGPLLKPVMSVA